MSNPDVRSRLVFYPEEPLCGHSELCHSSKWFSELPDDKLTPMWEHNGAHFYVGELASDACGEFVVPLRWFTSGGIMHMFYYHVVKTLVSQVSIYALQY